MPERKIIDLLGRILRGGKPQATTDLTIPAVAPNQESAAAASPAYQTDQEELTPMQAEIREEAERLAEELSKIRGRKALVLVVDDGERKRLAAEKTFQQAAAERNIGYSVSLKENGEDAIALYEAFRQADSSRNQTPTTVVIVLDGDLARRDSTAPYKKGFQVAERISEISAREGWEMPKLISNSTEPFNNGVLKDKFPDTLLAVWETSDLEMLNSIEPHLK